MEKMGREKTEKGFFLLSRFNALLRASHISVSDSVSHSCILIVTTPTPFSLS